MKENNIIKNIDVQERRNKKNMYKLVIDANVPKACEDCKFICLFGPNEAYPKNYCIATSKFIKDIKTKPKGCPIKEVKL